MSDIKALAARLAGFYEGTDAQRDVLRRCERLFESMPWCYDESGQQFQYIAPDDLRAALAELTKPKEQTT